METQNDDFTETVRNVRRSGGELELPESTMTVLSLTFTTSE